MLYITQNFDYAVAEFWKTEDAPLTPEEVEKLVGDINNALNNANRTSLVNYIKHVKILEEENYVVSLLIEKEDSPYYQYMAKYEEGYPPSEDGFDPGEEPELFCYFNSQSILMDVLCDKIDSDWEFEVVDESYDDEQSLWNRIANMKYDILNS